MDSYIGSNNCNDYRIGNNTIKKLYKGDTLIWEKSVVPTAVTGTVINYTSIDGNIVTIKTPCQSNTYDDNGGHMQFGTVLTEMPSFDLCYTLQTIQIPNTITYIGDDTFGSCAGLTALTIPSSVTGISFIASLSNNIQILTIPSSVTKTGFGCANMWKSNDINPYVFVDCPKIDLGMFGGNDYLRSIYVGPNVSEIDVLAFIGDYNLMDMYFSGDCPKWITLVSDEYVPTNGTFHFNTGADVSKLPTTGPFATWNVVYT